MSLLSTILLIIVCGLVLYGLGRIIYGAVILGIKQAEMLEKQFGRDVVGAAKYQFGMRFLEDTDEPDH